MTKFFAGLCAFVLVSFFGAIWSGYVLSVLWGWFVVPTFAAPSLNVPTAIGLALVAQYLTHQMHKSEQKTFGEILLEGAIHSATKPLVSLAFGAVVRLWL